MISVKRFAPALALCLGLMPGAVEAPRAASKPAAKAKPAAAPAPTATLTPPAPVEALPPIDTNLTQSESGIALIFGVLSGKLDRVTPYLADSLRADVTPEVLEGIRSQYSWLYELIGGDFHETMKGPRTFQDGTRTFYREYVLGQPEARAPLLAIQVLFPDSTRPKALGMQVKSFLGNEKLISGEKRWKVEGRDVDVHSVVLAEGAQNQKFMALFVHDPDTSALDPARIGRVGPPIIREAIQRGFLDTAKAANGGMDVQEQVGLVFMRRDPEAGFIHVRVAFGPQEYAVGGIEKLLAARADSARTDSAAAQEAPKTAPKSKAKPKKK